MFLLSTVCSMLNLQKQSKTRCVSIEEQLVWLIMSAMERSEADPIQTDADESQSPTHWLWVHISSQLIYFVLFQFASFPNIVISLHDKVKCAYGFSWWMLDEFWFFLSWLYVIYVRAEIISCGRFYNLFRVAYNAIHCQIFCQSSVCMTFCIRKENPLLCQIAQKRLTALDKWHLHVRRISFTYKMYCLQIFSFHRHLVSFTKESSIGAH